MGGAAGRTGRGRRIGIGLNPQVEIDAAPVARGLALEPARFRELMEQGRIQLLCERGVGEDAGLYRATFYYEGRRLRMVVDGAGTPVAPVETRPQPPSQRAAAEHRRPA